VTLPAPPTHHKLEGAIFVLYHQLTRTKAYLEAVSPALRAQNADDENVQFCFQTIVLMLHTFIEEHYRVLLSTATIYQPDVVRRYLAKRRPDQTDEIMEAPGQRLMRIVRSEVCFRNRAKKLKSIFDCLFGVGPFADEDAEAKCLDLVKARNVITHEGGKLDQGDVPEFASPELVVRRRTFGAHTIQQLHIQPIFLNAAMQAFSQSLAKIDASLRQDPRYSW
jgi:hypothetical protein